MFLYIYIYLYRDCHSFAEDGHILDSLRVSVEVRMIPLAT